jgi:hypothetical protein
MDTQTLHYIEAGCVLPKMTITVAYTADKLPYKWLGGKPIVFLFLAIIK